MDLLIAANAVAARALYTQNPSDFAELSELLEVVAVEPAEQLRALATVANPEPPIHCERLGDGQDHGLGDGSRGDCDQVPSGPRRGRDRQTVLAESALHP
jgi:hypothetical protein